jgi:hypothetical protein
MAQPGMGFSKNEWIAFLAAIVLAAAGMTIDNMPIIISSWSFVGLILCYMIYSHSDVPASFRILLCTCVLILTGGLIYYLREEKIERDSHQIFGRMYPSNIDTSHLIPCQHENSIAIYIGANTDCVTRFPLPLLNIDGDPIITLDRNSSGQIVITFLRLNDVNDYNLATITGNNYWTNPNVRKEISHDRDHLTVYDTSGQKALNIEVMNPDHLSIAGEFYHHKYHFSIGLQKITLYDPAGYIASLTDDLFFNHRIRVSKDGILFSSPDRNTTSLLVQAHAP